MCSEQVLQRRREEDCVVSASHRSPLFISSALSFFLSSHSFHTLFLSHTPYPLQMWDALADLMLGTLARLLSTQCFTDLAWPRADRLRSKLQPHSMIRQPNHTDQSSAARSRLYKALETMIGMARVCKSAMDGDYVVAAEVNREGG